MRLDHAIFHQPFEAGITLEDVAVPASYRHYAAGKSLPEKMSAWRVEKFDGTAQCVRCADGLKLVEKGRRNGQELRWADLANGNAALNAALSASTER